MKTNRRPRGPISRSKNTFVGGWMPQDLVDVMDTAIAESDSDRSKFLRSAVREKIARAKATAA